MGFKSSVTSGVLSTLVAAILTWLFGFWPYVLDSIVDIASTAWWRVAHVVPVPVGVLLVLSFVLVYLLNRLHSVLDRTAVSTTVQPMLRQSEMSENELAIIRSLAAADGRWLGIEHIASRIQKPRLLSEQALERLLTIGLLLQSTNYIHGSSFRLSPTGRDYAIDQGFVK